MRVCTRTRTLAEFSGLATIAASILGAAFVVYKCLLEHEPDRGDIYLLLFGLFTVAIWGFIGWRLLTRGSRDANPANGGRW